MRSPDTAGLKGGDASPPPSRQAASADPSVDRASAFRTRATASDRTCQRHLSPAVRLLRRRASTSCWGSERRRLRSSGAFMMRSSLYPFACRSRVRATRHAADARAARRARSIRATRACSAMPRGRAGPVTRSWPRTSKFSFIRLPARRPSGSRTRRAAPRGSDRAATGSPRRCAVPGRESAGTRRAPRCCGTGRR